MNHFTDEIKRKYKSKLVDVFRAFILLCKENNLRYYCLGGTLIGAVRHQGMIPWDDDIDVAMPREDYYKFLSLQFGSDFPYEIISMENNSNYYLPQSKFCDKNSTILEHADIPCIFGLFIDVFPLDGASDSLAERENDLLSFKRLTNKLHIQPKSSLSNFKSCLKRLIKGQLRTARNEFSLAFWKEKSRQKLVIEINKLMLKYPYKESLVVGNYGGMWGIKEFWKKEWFDNNMVGEFEGIKVLLPIGTAQILNQVYGDYMQLPPIEKQVSHHHLAYLNLEERISYDDVKAILNKNF